MLIPLDKKVETLADLPYTLSFVIRKRQQLDSLAELPKDKQPPDSILWEGTPEDLDEWIDRVLDTKHQATIADIVVSDIEG